jgi:hypothetical protein
MEMAKVWRSGDNAEVIKHWPPQLIVGQQVGEEREVARYEDSNVEIRLVEVTCEYMPSNPTGLFNLSLPEKLLRTKNYTFVSYEKYKEMLKANQSQNEESAKTEDA